MGTENEFWGLLVQDFYKLDAFPVILPIVSKHWKKQLINGIALSLSLRFNGHFSRWTWVNRFIGAKEVMGTSGAIRRAKLQSSYHHQQTNTQLFTGRLPFLLPNQQSRALRKKLMAMQYTLYLLVIVLRAELSGSWFYTAKCFVSKTEKNHCWLLLFFSEENVLLRPLSCSPIKTIKALVSVRDVPYIHFVFALCIHAHRLLKWVVLRITYR